MKALRRKLALPVLQLILAVGLWLYMPFQFSNRMLASMKLTPQQVAGEWTSRMAALITFPIVKKTPVCGQFTGAEGDKTIAAAQLQPPGTDVYINTSKLKKLKQGTILHEALHNLTGLEDVVDDPTILDLKGLLGIPRTSGPTDDISRILEVKGCVGTN